MEQWIGPVLLEYMGTVFSNAKLSDDSENRNLSFPILVSCDDTISGKKLLLLPEGLIFRRDHDKAQQNNMLFLQITSCNLFLSAISAFLTSLFINRDLFVISWGDSINRML